MTEQPFLITLQQVKEHENGDATYVFDMTEAAEKSVMEEGLKLLLFCGVAKVDLQDVYDWILAQEDKRKPESKLPEGRNPLSDDWFREKAAAFSYDDISPMTDEERKRAKEREEANKCTP